MHRNSRGGIPGHELGAEDLRQDDQGYEKLIREYLWLKDLALGSHYTIVGVVIPMVRWRHIMRATATIIPSLFTMLGVLLPGCLTFQPMPGYDKSISSSSAQVNYNDPVLNRRQILLFGPIDQRASEVTIQKLLFLDSKGHEPIDLFLQTPGGEVKFAWAIEETMRFIQSPVNTYALSECNSGGAVLLAAGTGKRRAFHGAVIVLHGVAVHGKPPPEFTQRIQESYTELWRKHARLPAAWLPLPFDCKHILTAEQALEYGIVDEVINK